MSPSPCAQRSRLPCPFHWQYGMPWVRSVAASSSRSGRTATLVAAGRARGGSRTNARSASTNQRPCGPNTSCGAVRAASTTPHTVTPSVATSATRSGVPSARVPAAVAHASPPATAARASAGAWARPKLRQDSEVSRRPRCAMRKKFTASAIRTPTATPLIPQALPNHAPTSTQSAYTSCRHARRYTAAVARAVTSLIR